MKSFRERLGIRQDFDNWSKGINNTLNNLRKQGFEKQAQQNIDYLKAQGYQFRQDKNGNEVLSRAGENKQTYKESTQQETEQIKKDLWNVKRAKEALKQMEEQEQENEDDDFEEDDGEEWGDDIFDVFDFAMDFYDLCKILASELQKLSPELSDMTAQKCTKMFDGVTGGWKGHEQAYINKAREIYQEYKDYYEILKSRYDDDYIDL